MGVWPDLPRSPIHGENPPNSCCHENLSASILGDPYIIPESLEPPVVANRMYLHAAALAFDYEEAVLFNPSRNPVNGLNYRW